MVPAAAVRSTNDEKEINVYTEDGITTWNGGDEPLVSLWDGGITRAGDIRDLCQTIRDVVDGELPLTVYIREGDELTEATLSAQMDGPDRVWVAVETAAGSTIKARYCV